MKIFGDTIARRRNNENHHDWNANDEKIERTQSLDNRESGLGNFETLVVLEKARG